MPKIREQGSTPRFLFFVVLRILLRNHCVELLLLFRGQQGTNPCPRLHSRFFKAWSYFGAQGSILVARFIKDGADGCGLLISKVQFRTHLFEALVHGALARFSAAAGSA